MRPEARMILTIGGLGLGAVLVMGMMAQRISSAVSEKTVVEEKRQSSSAFRTQGVASRPSEHVGATETPAATNVPNESTRSTEPAEDRALRYVDAFLSIRRAMHVAWEASQAESLARQTEVARVARDAELARSWMQEHEYRQILMIYRAWKGGESGSTQEFGKALDTRRNTVVLTDLGPLELQDL